jgi:hypothetical protein
MENMDERARLIDPTDDRPFGAPGPQIVGVSLENSKLTQGSMAHWIGDSSRSRGSTARASSMRTRSLSRPKRQPRVTALLIVLAGPACRERAATPQSDAPATASSPGISASSERRAPPPIAVLALPAGYGTSAFSAREVVASPDPKWNDGGRVAIDEEFVFELGTGDGLDGLDVTTLSGSGRGRHTWRSVMDGGAHWNTVEFAVAKDDLRELAGLLGEIQFLEQPRGIVAKDVHDGASWIVHVHTRGREKYVALSNAFPPPFLRLGRFVVALVNRDPQLRDRRLEFSAAGLHDRHLWQGVEAYEGSSDARFHWICLVPEASRPFAIGTRVRASLLDRTLGKTRARMASRISPGQSSACLNVSARDVDASHDYVLELDLVTAAGENAQIAPAAVLTKGAPRVVVMPRASGK